MGSVKKATMPRNPRPHKPARPFPNPNPMSEAELDKLNGIYPPRPPKPEDFKGFPRTPGSHLCAGENDELLPGNFLMHCDDTFAGGGYTYTIEVSPDDTVLALKEKIATPNEEVTREQIANWEKEWHPPRPRMPVEEMFLRFGSMGIVDDNATFKELGIGDGCRN